jgi:signal transduction histidine kinase
MGGETAARPWGRPVRGESSSPDGCAISGSVAAWRRQRGAGGAAPDAAAAQDDGVLTAPASSCCGSHGTMDTVGAAAAAALAAPPPAVVFRVPRWLLSYALGVSAVIWFGRARSDASALGAVAALPTRVHETPAAAFFVVAVVHAVSLALHGGSRLGWCAALNCFVGSLTACTNLLHLFPATRIARRTAWGAVFLPLRYVSWMHTTPALIALMASLCSVRRPRECTYAIIADELMFVFGICGSLVRSPWGVAVCMLASSAWMAVVLALVWRWFTEAMAAAQPGSVQWRALAFGRGHTMFMWCCFPAIVAVEMLSPHTPATLLAFEACYAVADFVAKILWASLLVQGNALVAESHSRSSREYLADSARDELVARLRGALTLRDRLLSATGHELRTPLNGARARPRREARCFIRCRWRCAASGRRGAGCCVRFCGYDRPCVPTRAILRLARRVGPARRLRARASPHIASASRRAGIVGLADKLLSNSAIAALPPPSPRISSYAGVASAAGGGPPTARMSSVGAPGGGGLSAAAAAEATRALSAIKASGVRLLALVDDLADDASLTAQRHLTLSCAPVDLYACVAEILGVHEGLQSTGVRLVNAVPRGLPPVLADRARLAQALHKLLAVAARDTHAGSITVAAEAVVWGADADGDADADAGATAAAADCCETVGNVGIAAAAVAAALAAVASGGAPLPRAANMVALSVTDTGAGAEALRDAGGEATMEEDLGLGLHGARELVEAHGGCMEVCSAHGGGTRVTVTLPLARDPFGDGRLRSLDGGACAANGGGSGRASSDGSRRSLDGLRGGSGPAAGTFAGGAAAAFARRNSGLFEAYAPQGTPPVNSPSFGAMQALSARNGLSLDSHPAQAEWLTLSGGAPTPVVMCIGGVSNQAALAELLTGAFTVRCARDIDAALTQLAGPDAPRRCWPDVILLDVNAGLPAIARLHAVCPANTALPPVIVLLPSGAADDGRAALCIDAGAAEILRAPLARDLLHARIHMQLMQLRLRNTAHEARTSMALLRRMLPDGVISRLKEGQSLIAESMDAVTILFSDVVSFTSLASEVPTTDLVIMLNELFSAFDALCDKHQCYKVRAGDATLTAPALRTY